jgi:L-amino acid N-acyltransferase YncA
MSPTVREATEADLEAMAAIHDRAIIETDAIWLDEPLGADRFAQKIADHRDAGDAHLEAP